MKFRNTVSATAAVLFALTAVPATAQKQPLPPGAKVLDYVDSVPRAPNGMITRVGLQMLGLDVQTALDAQNFEKLERLHGEFRDGRARAYDGTWLLEAFEIGADAWTQGGNAERLDALSAKWAKAYPESQARPGIVGLLWVKVAWKARGSSTAGGVAPEGWKLFETYMGKAGEALGSGPKEAQASPIWYQAALQVLGPAGSPQLPALYAEAIKQHPGYYKLHEARVNFSLPQWGGSFKQVAGVVDGAVQVTKEKEGGTNYALLYHFTSRRTDWSDFAQSGYRWPVMKAGFEDLVSRHPDPYNWALYGYWACRQRDKEATARVLKAMPGLDVGGFHSSITTEGCKLFAGA